MKIQRHASSQSTKVREQLADCAKRHRHAAIAGWLSADVQLTPMGLIETRPRYILGVRRCLLLSSPMSSRNLQVGSGIAHVSAAAHEPGDYQAYRQPCSTENLCAMIEM
jgi:hypothetical protein